MRTFPFLLMRTGGTCSKVSETHICLLTTFQMKDQHKSFMFYTQIAHTFRGHLGLESGHVTAWEGFRFYNINLKCTPERINSSRFPKEMLHFSTSSKALSTFVIILPYRRKHQLTTIQFSRIDMVLYTRLRH